MRSVFTAACLVTVGLACRDVGSHATGGGAGSATASTSAPGDAAAGVGAGPPNGVDAADARACPYDPALGAAMTDAIDFAEQRVRATVAWLLATHPTDATTWFPAVTSPTTGEWDLAPRRSPLVSSRAEDWRSGYFPGVLYQLHRATKKQDLLSLARSWSGSIEALVDRPIDHDIGQRFLASFGVDYAITGDAHARDVLARAAHTLDRRFDMGGVPVGALRALDDWPPGPYPVYIDSMANVPLLFAGGLADHGLRHSATVLRDHLRADGSSYHIVQYADDGSVYAKITDQGYSAESTWSRGQTWGIHGFATVYGLTGDARMLATAERMATYFVRRLPADRVPPVDFDAPDQRPRDSSAGAIAAAGLLELASLSPTRHDEWCTAATGILRSLLTTRDAEGRLVYLAKDSPHRGVLANAAVAYGTPPVSLVLGDFYLLDAINRMLSGRSGSRGG